MSTIKSHIVEFMKSLYSKNGIQLYNEAGLQFELAFYLKEQLGSSWKIELERNIKDLGLTSSDVNFKRDIDIYLINSRGYQYCIELKFPSWKSPIPRRTFNALQDIAFLEQLKKQKFKACYSLFITPNFTFFNPNLKTSGIYRFLRKERKLSQPKKEDLYAFITDKKDYKKLKIESEYPIRINKLTNHDEEYHYYLVKV